MVAKIANLLRRWPLTVPEPRYESYIFGTAYLFFTLTGLATITLPPRTIEGVLGTAGISIVGWFFLIGGVTGMATGWAGWWQFERWGIGLLGGGLIVYISIVAQLHFTGGGSRFTQLGIMCIATCVVALRLGKIIRYPFKPRGDDVDAD